MKNLRLKFRRLGRSQTFPPIFLPGYELYGGHMPFSCDQPPLQGNCLRNACEYKMMATPLLSWSIDTKSYRVPSSLHSHLQETLILSLTATPPGLDCILWSTVIHRN